MAEEVLTTSPSVRETENADGLALLDVDQGICFSMNPVGAQIWNLLKQKYSVDQIAKYLSQQYSIAVELASQDIDEFVTNLKSHKLIVCDPPNATGRFDRLLALAQRFKGTQST
jgi:hypothetical protein